MIYEPLQIPEIIKITPKKFCDGRGYLMETFRQSEFLDFLNCDVNFVQANHSFSIHAFTVRGLHFQNPPNAQGKLVRCTRGSIIDVAVDVRANSETFGKHVSTLLSSENGCQLWIPEGFLHGFATLEPGTEVQYKCTNYYSAEKDGNIFWNDPSLGIDWMIDPQKALLSEKDAKAPLFDSFKTPFIL